MELDLPTPVSHPPYHEMYLRSHAVYPRAKYVSEYMNMVIYTFEVKNLTNLTSICQSDLIFDHFENLTMPPTGLFGCYGGMARHPCVSTS
jgi:hypothetical protein